MKSISYNFFYSYKLTAGTISLPVILFLLLLICASPEVKMLFNLSGRTLTKVFFVAVDLKTVRSRLMETDKKLILPLKNPEIVIYKSARKLELYDGKTLVKTYKVALSSSSTGHKEHEGDLKTPEGNYRICYLNPNSSFHLFMGINYPNATDAQVAYANKIIDKKTYKLISKAEYARKTPPWNTVMGGQVGIHGGGNEQDWTLGCIALENPDVEELWVAVKYWTPVTIKP